MQNFLRLDEARNVKIGNAGYVSAIHRQKLHTQTRVEDTISNYLKGIPAKYQQKSD